MKYDYRHESTLRVRYSETDQMGYCYYGNFLQFFEIARVECLRAIGISYKELENNGVLLPVKDVQVDYKHPCFYDELLRIETELTEINSCRIFFAYKVFNEQTKLCTLATTTLVFLEKESKRPISCPSEILEKLSPYEK